jgi:isochorismate pyruvate lyase
MQILQYYYNIQSLKNRGYIKMQYHPVLLPAECHDMSDISREIDHIDYTVIQLLSVRFNYVKTASKFKKNTTDVQATERFNSMLEKRKQWADEAGLNGEVIKALYADLVNYFIAEELKEFKSK